MARPVGGSVITNKSTLTGRKIDFHDEYLRNNSDSGTCPLASTEINSTEIAFTEINFAETAESLPDHPFLADAGLNQPLPLAKPAFPGSTRLGPENIDFNVKRSWTRRREI